jgi:hypothetical protein
MRDCDIDTNGNGSGIGGGEEIDRNIKRVKKARMFREALRWLMLDIMFCMD